MIYYRCKCGNREALSSMGVPECTGCPECKTTLATHAGGHTDIQPHTLGAARWEIDPDTGERWQQRMCTRCGHIERVMT